MYNTVCLQLESGSNYRRTQHLTDTLLHGLRPYQLDATLTLLHMTLSDTVPSSQLQPEPPLNSADHVGTGKASQGTARYPLLHCGWDWRREHDDVCGAPRPHSAPYWLSWHLSCPVLGTQCQPGSSLNVIVVGIGGRRCHLLANWQTQAALAGWTMMPALCTSAAILRIRTHRDSTMPPSPAD